MWKKPEKDEFAGSVSYEVVHDCGIFCSEARIANLHATHVDVCTNKASSTSSSVGMSAAAASSVSHGYAYKFKVRAKNAYGWGPYSSYVWDTATAGKLLCEFSLLVRSFPCVLLTNFPLPAPLLI